MTLKFVPVTEADREFFVHAHYLTYHAIVHKMFGWDKTFQDNFASQTFDDGGMNIIWHEGKKVGIVGWKEYPDYLWLKEVFVLPEYQGQGIGSQVVAHSIDRAKKEKKPLWLETPKESIKAKKLYESHGLKVIEETQSHWNMVWGYDG